MSEPHNSVYQLLRCVVFYLYAERFQELNVLIADLQFGIAGQGGDHGALVRLLTRAADADRGFEYQEDIVTTVFDPRNNIGDLVRIR